MSINETNLYLSRYLYLVDYNAALLSVPHRVALIALRLVDRRNFMSASYPCSYYNLYRDTLSRCLDH